MGLSRWRLPLYRVLCCRRRCSIVKVISFGLVFTVGTLVVLSLYGTQLKKENVRSADQSPIVGSTYRGDSELINIATTTVVQFHPDPTSVLSVVDNRILVIVESRYTQEGKALLSLLDSCRFRVKVETGARHLPSLTHRKKGKFALIVFEKLETYLEMDQWNRELLDKYCVSFRVGIIAFTHPAESLTNAKVKGLSLYITTNLTIQNYLVDNSSSIPRIIRPSVTWLKPIEGNDWAGFSFNDSTFVPLATAAAVPRTTRESMQHYHIAVHDNGQGNGVRKVLFGNNLQFWLHRVLLLDSVHYLTEGQLSIPLERYLLVDIDDVFVSKEGSRMTPQDVKALLYSQYALRQYVIGFTFNLGFSGFFFQRGTPLENEGDRMLIEFKDEFWWFPHMFSHTQPHLLNLTTLTAEMTRNKEFALAQGLMVNQSYAVAPHHSGVYPVHEDLYTAWHDVWRVKVTSTEEYPHLRPAHQRRGFTYREIQVLPRQTCGLYTHTIFFDNPNIPDFRQKLDNSIDGGELFMTFIQTPVLIFMTHMPNYSQDRLGIYTFTRMLDFLRHWTALQISTVPPGQLGSVYFSQYPDERTPVWTNPCQDGRHIEIWSKEKDCKRLPDFLIIGPQKTGTTALFSFLSLHPAILSSYSSVTTFEEVQFFSGDNYLLGLDWYMSRFPPRQSNRSWPLIFDKSATYFDSALAPARAYSLLPEAKIIVILIDPAQRAYSWYQHQLAHKHPAALAYSFEDVLRAHEGWGRSVRELRQRCLHPGLYAQHLEEWLAYYPSNQLLVLDGDQLKLNPLEVMDKVQIFLDAQPYMDYSFKLRYSEKKGYYCAVDTTQQLKCLGKSKGRVYPPLSAAATNGLTEYYHQHNMALLKLLTKHGQEVPSWLRKQISS